MPRWKVTRTWWVETPTAADAVVATTHIPRADVEVELEPVPHVDATDRTGTRFCLACGHDWPCPKARAAAS